MVVCEDGLLISDWDEPETERAELQRRSAAWTDVAAATEARRIGVNRIRIDPGMWMTPAQIGSAARTASGSRPRGVIIAADNISILDD